MRFGVLGPLAVWTTEGREVRVPEVKVRMLLAALLVAAGRPVAADRLADDLWGDRQPGNPTNTLQTKISQLRRVLEKAEPGGRDLVAYHAPGYVMRVDVDVARFRDLVARAKEDPGGRVALLAEALGLWRGPVLAEFADFPFVVPFVQRLTEERLVAWEEWASARLDLGEHGELVGELGELVAEYPLRERLRGLQMRALYLAGRQSEALASFAELRSRLADELGLEPGPETASIQQAILTQSLPGTVPRTTTPQTNLPAPLTELVGRDAAIRSVRKLVAETRLVTLTGPGGVGKTRLAIEVARQVGNAWLVEFTGHDHIGDDGVREATAAALGVRDDDLLDALRDREILLVLDNCERVVSSVARLASTLLKAAPGLRVLATSQEPLGLAGEVLWNVPALEVPEQSTSDVLAYSAARLFVARASDAGFVYTPDKAAAVAAICRRLDGIPLALELAATRVRALGVDQLLNRLSDRFRLLDNGSRDAPARQRTLRAMIDWSWDLLTPPAQVVLRRLAVHRDGCELDAAETLCAAADVRPEDVLGLLAGLVDRSLVSSGPRYRLLESVAAYCVERLADAGELAEMRRRHAGYYVELAERADPLLRTSSQRGWLERLDAESGNLRRALETLHDDSVLALRLVNALVWYWFLRGRLGEARRSLRQALAIPGDGPRAYATAWLAGLGVLAGEAADMAGFAAADDIEDPAQRARALWFLGYVTATMGDPGSTRLTDQALALFEAQGDQWGIAAALDDRVTQWTGMGDFVAAERDAVVSAKLFEELGERWGQLQSSFTLGMLAQARGDHAEAERLHRNGLRMAEELGLWTEVSYQLSWLGRVAMSMADYPRAWELHSRAMRLGAEQGFKPAEMYAETGLAMGARREGRLDVAEKHLLHVLEWHRQGGFEAGSSLILAELGFVAELRGDAAEARRWQTEGLKIAKESGGPRAVALALEGLAGVAALEGSTVDAAGLLDEAARIRESVGRPLPQAQRGDVDRITATIEAHRR
ncbi:BTAD domain-containing putative transcriptional regulator [Actinocrispum wychmicini]|uniref:BTAD domain-containing putative transcriptional regulator n=1 Tax=Actinocrispum wychmicini TaxID=1213861 RepID=UPI00104841A0|nr:BTAD domain-containing putative transcriptional regulator [Actinocrispum wychmicini]